MTTTPKLKQSETVTIKRSQISFAPYNPRRQNKKVVDALKKNFKKVGFLGGIQWNETTGNLIGGHKRCEALDLIFGYDGTNDYDIRVEKCQLDEKTEKEQNIFLNNKRVQGETDFDLLAAIMPDIDTDAAGLDDYDIDLVESLVPNFKQGNNSDIKNDIAALKNQSQKTDAEKTEHVKGVKAAMKQGIAEGQLKTHFTVTFKTYDEKAEFLESIGINGDDIFITHTRFLKALDNN